jgi:glycerol kinase
MKYIISIDQSTQSTKAFLFDSQCEIVNQKSIAHRQYYPRTGWVEHDAEEIYGNVVKVIEELVEPYRNDSNEFSIAITNQRETVVVWDRKTGKPVYNAIVWESNHGEEICNQLIKDGYNDLVRERSGLLINPYFAGSGAKWILDNLRGVRQKADNDELCFGTIDSWLIFRLTKGKRHVTDCTNASRTMLFNIHTLQWDEDLLRMLAIPRSMMPEILSCDAVYGETTVEGFFSNPIKIAGVLGDSHGALVGQMCFNKGYGKVTYGTGSSVMVNIGDEPILAPDGLVTSVGFSAFGKVYYAFEGNIHCTGGTITWLKDRVQLIDNFEELENLATSVNGNGGVYLVPAFSGLGAPWWNSQVKGMLFGLTLGADKAYICRAALESIAYQITDLIKVMTDLAGIYLQDIRVDGGPTTNKFLMQFQADMLQVPVVRVKVVDASAFGAMVMNRFALKEWSSFDDASAIWKPDGIIKPEKSKADMQTDYDGWHQAISQLLK